MVYQARTAAGLTQAALAERVGSTQSVISAIENGSQQPTIATSDESHAPSIARNLLDDLNRMIDLVELRSQLTAAWVRSLEDVTQTIAERP